MGVLKGPWETCAYWVRTILLKDMSKYFPLDNVFVEEKSLKTRNTEKKSPVIYHLEIAAGALAF